MRQLTISAILLLIWGCGGPATPIEEPQKAAEDDTTNNSEKAIGIVRASLDAMGGIERLRLKGARATIMATGASDDDSIPIQVTIAGPDRWRFDYLESGLSYIYSKGVCRKIAYDIPARCTASEERWMEPLQLFHGLVYPNSDAANLGATFRDKGEQNVDGAPMNAIELRKRNTNLRMNVFYDKQTNLLARVDFELGDAGGNKVKWTIDVSDWKEMEGIKVPFSKTLKRDGEIVWKETADFCDLSAEDSSFEMPPPPTTDHPLQRNIPARRVIVSVLEGQKVEIPAPHTAFGAGPDLGGEPIMLPQIEAVRMVVKSKTAKVPALKKSFEGDVPKDGEGQNEEPHVILFEQPAGPDDPVLMMLYTKAPLKEEETTPQAE